MPTTRFYFTDTVPPVTVTRHVAWTMQAASSVPRSLVTVRPSGTLAGGTAQETVTTQQNMLVWQGIGSALTAQAMSGSFALAVMLSENLSGADAYLRVIARVVSSDGATVRGVLFDATETLETGTASSVRTMTGALTPVTAQAGDRVVIEVGAALTNTTTLASGVTIAGGSYSSPDLAATDGSTVSGVPWVDLILDGAPNPPRNLVQTATYGDRVTVGWDAPLSGPVPTSYEYQFDNIIRDAIPLGSRSATITGLSPNSGWPFSVRSKTSSGTSAWLDGVISTLNRPNPVLNLRRTAARTDGTGLTFEWDAGPTDANTMAVESFEYQVDAGPVVSTALGRVVTLTGLLANTSYSVKVRARSVAQPSGTSYTSSWRTVVMSTLGPAQTPTGLVKTGSTTTSISFAWAPSSGETVATGYQYRINGGSLVGVGMTTSGSATGLFPETGYSVEVRALSPSGNSPWSPPLTIATDPVTPPPPPPPPPPSECYAMVRGSGIRVTAVGELGGVTEPRLSATSKSVARVKINEIVEQGRSEVVKSPEEARRLRIMKSAEMIRYSVDIDFLRVDPGLFRIIAGVPGVLGYSRLGFGEAPFGAFAFGSSGTATLDAEVGFDATTRLKPVGFALEVWSKLAGQRCADGSQKWGYTLFPHLRGGRLSGFKFENGLVSFSLIGAQTRRGSRWGVGPYDLEGEFERLTSPVSGNTHYRTAITSAPPPEQTNGIMVTPADVIDNGTASNPQPDPTAPESIDGGGAATSVWIIDGGRA